MDWPTRSASMLHGLDADSSATLLSRLLAIADDAVIVTDEGQRVVLFNEGAERIFGCRAREVLGLSLDRLLPEAARARHAEHLREFARSPTVARRMGERSEIRGLRSDGTLFDAEASISHLELGGRTYFAAILRDVTPQRVAQRSLQASEARFRTLAAAAPVGIFETDAEGQCRYVNERWCEIAGLPMEQALGLGWLAALHPADRARVRDAWRKSVAGRQVFDMRFRFLHTDGSEAWVIGKAVEMLDEAGAVRGHVGTVTDVTESQQQAQALERAKSEAEAAVRAKSLFLANMSHEIRTPLNAVIGMTTLLLDTPLSEDQHDFARTIRASGETLLEIINDILDYSKADVGRLEIESRPFDLRQCVEESLDMVAPRALEKRLNLACLLEEGTPEALLGDPARLRQVLVNLLSNGVKFTHQGEVFVLVKAVRDDDEGVRLRFEVSDTGIGIAAEQIPRLFQSFTQVDASTTRRYGGTGLGLAISKRLAELMGGAVDVRSDPGHGSVFGVEVLVQRAPGGAPADYLQRDAPALAGKHVLIVDDNLTNRRILTQMALRWGMLPSTLPSALEALDRVRVGEDYDVAILDMSMPGMDGLDLAKIIRDRPDNRRIPIVLLTSLGQRDALTADGERLVDACLAKPIKVGALYETLVAVTGGGAAALRHAAPPPPVAHAPANGLRLLVAEDNPINQRVVLRLLRHLGYRADLASDGRQVLEALQRQPYDLVLMDIQMPELDGLEAARRIVADRGTARRPRIIAMTANAMPGDREAYIGAGMDGYLAKPIGLGELGAALAQVAQLAGGEPDTDRHDAIDTARLEHLRSLQDDSQPALVRELIDMFCADAASLSGRVAEAHAAGDADRLRAAAHRFLSATQNIGARRLSALAARIESLARAGDLAAVAPLLAGLDAECRHAIDALALHRLRY